MMPDMATGMAAALARGTRRRDTAGPRRYQVGTACFAEGEVQVKPDQKLRRGVIVREFPPGARLLRPGRRSKTKSAAGWIKGAW